MTFEPRLEDSDKVDILWVYDDGSRMAEQVKSTIRHFRPNEVREWANELKKWKYSKGATRYQLTLAGPSATAELKNEFPDVTLHALTNSAEQLKIQAADALERFLEFHNLETGNRTIRLAVIGALESELFISSQRGSSSSNERKWTPATLRELVTAAIAHRIGGSGGPRRRLGEKTQIGAGGTLTLVSLLAAVAMITGHMKQAVENLAFLRSLSPVYVWSGMTVLLLTGVLLLRRGLSAGLRAPDAKRFVLDPEKDRKQFVGRTADLESLAQCLDEAQLVFLSGESGAGKSALINLGLRDFLRRDRSDLRLLPIVVDTYGASEDWDADLSARLASKFFDSLSTEERALLDLSERTTERLMERLQDCDSKVDRIPLLIFDQFDDYQNIHRQQFLRDRKWITPETLVEENVLWRAIQDALQKRTIKVLLVTRRDRFDPLESLRLVRPETYPLPGIASDEMRRLLRHLLAGAGLPEADSRTMADCVIGDLTDEAREVLPIRAALAFQGLASLDYLTPRHYRRKGGSRALEVGHVRRGVLHFAKLLRIDRRTACTFFRSMVDHGNPPKTVAAAISALAEQAKRSDDQVLDALGALARPAFRIVRKRIDATDAQGSEWSLYHDFLAPIVLEVQRQLDSANALLRQKHAAFRSAKGWWARWTALLSPWESLRLALAGLRRQVETAGYGLYLLASTLRFLPYAAAQGALFGWAGSRIATRLLAASPEVSSPPLGP